MADENTLLDQARAVTASSIPPHTLLLHTYEVEQLLARGGMGEVYLARHAELGTQHAIKVIKPELAVKGEVLDVLELFRREAAVLRGIRHEAVVGYDGFFRDEKKHCYLVMEYVDGPSLAQVFKQRPLSSDEVYRLRDRLAGGLAAAHVRGVIHRDVSPDNVILPEGRVENAKLIDFGIARLGNPAAGTIIGHALAGKWRYMAPEQLGLFGGEVGPGSDLYSLGLVLAAAAVGKPLDMGDSLETAIQARQRVPDLSRVPAELQPQLTAMLQPNPADRLQNVTELLQRWPRQRPLPPGPPAQRESNDTGWLRKYQAWLGIALVVVLAVTGAFFLLDTGHEPASPAGHKPPPEAQQPGLEEIATLPPEQIYDYARQFYDKGQLDAAQALWEQAGNQGHGPSALAMGELYDPLLWGKIPSPFSQPNGIQAEKWYRRASTLGVAEANARLQQLEVWKREQPTVDHQQ
jgi:serine/threonine protein kinase